MLQLQYCQRKIIQSYYSNQNQDLKEQSTGKSINQN